MANYLEGVSVWNTGPQRVGGNGIYIGPPDEQGLASRAALSILSHSDTNVRNCLVYGVAGDGITVIDDGAAQVEVEDTLSMSNGRDGLRIELSRGERRRLEAIERKRRKHARKG